MRVHVYKGVEGNLSVLVEPSPGKGRPPVLLHGITRENVAGSVLPVVTDLRRPRASRQSQAS